jgi:hypothetical protein
MAQYPQGVTSFIPDYQAYQPDFNFTANVLQLKQTQYDQNWNKLNNIYGQLLNAPLTHEESIKRRDNTLNRINFDLQRITGLDLSLEQNVQQAVQLFRPLYEDQNLMKDMVFTKNAGFEKALGEGKRISVDEKVNKEYWEGGLRAIDYKIQEFKETPYDQLTSFGDVQYTPYVNVEKIAQEMATKLNYKIKRTSPQGNWMVTEQNGEPLIPILQAEFYSAIGKDPKVKEFYNTQAYLDRKNWIMSNKDNPEFNGSAEAAESKYLNGALTMLQRQTELTKSTLLNEQKTNKTMIDKLEESIKNGTDTESTAGSLEKYREANRQIELMLAQNESDQSLITDNINKTLTTTGGSKLDFNDLNQMRSRVDAVMASTYLQGDLDEAAKRLAYLNYEQDYEANPFAVQRQKYLYDSSLIKQRANAQKEVAYFKYLLEEEKQQEKEKLSSGLYEKDPKTGKVKMKPELAEVQAVIDILGKTGQVDPKKLTTSVGEMYKNDAESAKTQIISVLSELQKEGVISNNDIINVLSDKNYSGFNMKPLLEYIKKTKNVTKGEIDPKMRDMILREGQYTTSLEKEMAIDENDVGTEEATAKLLSAAQGSLDDLSPEAITRMSKRMLDLIQKKKSLSSIKNNSTISEFIDNAHVLDDYSQYRKAYFNNKKQIATEIKNRLKAEGFNYAEFLFKDGYDFVATPEEFQANVRKWMPDHVLNDDGGSWGGFWNTTMSGGLIGSGIAGTPTAGVLSAPGFVVGAGIGAASYALTAGAEALWNLFSGGGPDNVELYNGNTDRFGSTYTVGEEYQAMMDEYDNMVQNSLLKTPSMVLHHKIGSRDLSGYESFANSDFGQWLGLQEAGTGLYTANGAGITIDPGVRSPTYDQFLEIKKALNSVNLNDTSGKDGYVSFTGVNTPLDQAGDIATNKEIFNAIYSDFIPKVSKKGEGLGRFQVQTSPFGGESVDNGAVVFRLPEDYLKKWKPDSKGEKLEGLTDEIYNDILTNGITVVTNAEKLQNVTMYKNSFKTAEQIRIETAGPEGVTYKDPRYPNYDVNFKIDPINPNTYTITQKFEQYDPNLKKMVQMENVKHLSNMGTNIKDFRSKFFNEFALQNDYQQNQIRRQYE